MLLKKKQVEALLQNQPWNQHILIVVLNKLVLKLEQKVQNKDKILQVITTFLDSQPYADSLITAETWSQIEESLRLANIPFRISLSSLNSIVFKTSGAVRRCMTQGNHTEAS